MNSGIKKFFSATELRFGLPFLLAFATIPAVALSALLSSCGNGSSAHSMGDPTVGTLVTEGNMTVGRSLHTATLLPTGEVLLVGGGTPDQSATRTVEIFDPRTGQTRTAAEMNVARADHTATLLPDGTVLIVGGLGPAASSAEIYEPATGTSTLVGPLTEPRSDHAAVLLESGKVLILGGDTSGVGASPTAGAELYDPFTRTFASTGRMSMPRVPCGVVRLNDGHVLVAGGTTTGKRVLASAEIYDPPMGQFTSTGSLLSARRKHAGAILADGTVLIMGGTASASDSVVLNSTESFDPAQGHFQPAPPMRSARYKFTAVFLDNGSLLVAGGSRETVEVFDQRTGQFMAVANGQQGLRLFPTATLLSDGSALIAGGYSGNGSQPTLWRYTP